jgi:hypothetical protein
MKKFLLIPLFTTVISLSFAQNNESTSFCQLDIATKDLSGNKDLLTDKILFSKNNKLEVKKSKSALDSMAWFLTRHPKTIISITLLKYQAVPLTNTDSQPDQEQLKQIAGYLSKKGINSKRIISLVSYHEQHAKADTIKTRIRVLSNDFNDTDAK